MSTEAKIVWDCREAESRIALAAGGDLDDRQSTELLDAHLASCPQCRGYFREMQSALDVLAAAQPAVEESTAPVLWSRVVAELPRRRPAATGFNFWLPTVAMSVACAAMVLVTIVQIEQVSLSEPILTPRVQSALLQDSASGFDLGPYRREVAPTIRPELGSRPVRLRASPQDFDPPAAGPSLFERVDRRDRAGRLDRPEF